jgi:hypothetical protein
MREFGQRGFIRPNVSTGEVIQVRDGITTCMLS